MLGEKRSQNNIVGLWRTEEMGLRGEHLPQKGARQSHRVGWCQTVHVSKRWALRVWTYFS